VPEAPSWENTISAQHSDAQDWPVKLGWTDYDREIGASEHADSLRGLITRVRCSCKKPTPNVGFLERGLDLVDHALVDYLKGAMIFVHKKHKAVVNAIVSG
jgi:hypothetical protein